MNTILLSVIVMAGMGIFFALFLLISYKKLSVEEDPRVKRIEDILPGANCGACGFPGCAAYAEAIVLEGAEINRCAPGGADVVVEIGKIMGIEAEAKATPVAHLMCQGSPEVAVQRSIYVGEPSCRVADFTTKGDKACTYGCLGLGDCVRVCPFNAMYMGEDNLPKIIEENCTGCGLCVEECPRDILALVPRDQKTFVACVNKDKGAISRKVCKVSCIACGLCVKKAPEGAMTMKDNLAVILDYKQVDTKAEEVYAVCPTKAIELKGNVPAVAGVDNG